MVLFAALALLSLPTVTARAYAPTSGTIYRLAVQPAVPEGPQQLRDLPEGGPATQWAARRGVREGDRARERGATGETLPVYKSDDYGTTWQPLSEVRAPAYMSSDPAVAKYVSNWTNPYFFVLPQAVGNLAAGNLLLATVVSGRTTTTLEHKAADPNWAPTNDGDRKDLAIALFSSTNQGVFWNFVNIIAAGGWQGGSAGANGANIANANTSTRSEPSCKSLGWLAWGWPGRVDVVCFVVCDS